MTYSFELLDPHGPPTGARALLADVRRNARPRERRPFVFVNMVETVDGRAALHGSAHGLAGPADTEMLLELRTIADAVLVGSNTIAVEGYARLIGSEERRAYRRDVLGIAQDPPCVIVTRSGTVPWEAGLFAAAEQPVIIYTDVEVEVPGRVAAPVEVVRGAGLEDVLADQRRRGVHALLCEGGPHLNAALVGAGLMDELFVTLAASLRGDDREPGIVAGRALASPRRLMLRWVLRESSDVFLRYAVTPG